MFLLWNLIPLVPCLVNLSFSLWVAWCFRRHPLPPLWAIVVLLIFGASSIRLLFVADFPDFCVVLLTVLNAIFCVAMALAMICRRQGLSHLKSWIVASLIVLPTSMWVDYRFRIDVVDGQGSPARVDSKNINFHRPNTYWKDFYYGYGTTLKKGVVYFGFCQWVMFREDWIVFGTVGDPPGPYTNFEITKPDWSKWPITVTVKTP